MTTYMIYHISGNFLVVNEEERAEFLKTKEWFTHPHDAEKAKAHDIQKIENEVKEELATKKTRKEKVKDAA